MILPTDLTQWVTPMNAAGLLVAYLSFKLIYVLYLSPLRNVPGPLFAKFSGLSPLIMDFAGRRAKTIESLHQKYGPVVQLGPNEISVNTIDAIDLVYGPQSECIKSPWYDSVTRDGVFKLRNVAEHRYRRKQISRAFSPASANEMEGSTAALVKKFMGIINERSKNGALEMRHWFRMLVFDLAGIAFTGETNRGLECEESPQFVKDMDNAFLIWDLEGRFPWLMWVVERAPLKALQHFFNGTDRLYQYSTAAFEKYIGLYGRTPDRKDIISKLIQNSSTGVEALSDHLIKCEIANLTFAATDTTSVVLTFLFWELALNPKLQKELRVELQNAQVDPETGVAVHQSLVNLPLLDAVIQETMRKHSPIPMGLLRQAPKAGLTVDGYFVPGETVVSVPSYLSHRDPKYFPDPDSFQPSRWIDTDGGTEEMKKLYMPFGKGRHKCAGQAMAMLSMRVIVATLVLKYEVQLAKDAKLEDMEWDDHFLIMLRKGCFLDLTPV